MHGYFHDAALARAQKLMRHSTPMLTSKYYTRPDMAKLAAEVEKLGKNRELGGWATRGNSSFTGSVATMPTPGVRDVEHNSAKGFPLWCAGSIPAVGLMVMTKMRPRSRYVAVVSPKGGAGEWG